MQTHGCLLLPTHNLQRCKGLGRLSGSIGLQLCASLPGIFLPLCSIAVMISFVVVPDTQAQVGMIGCARGQRYPFTPLPPRAARRSALRPIESLSSIEWFHMSAHCPRIVLIIPASPLTEVPADHMLDMLDISTSVTGE